MIEKELTLQNILACKGATESNQTACNFDVSPVVVPSAVLVRDIEGEIVRKHVRWRLSLGALTLFEITGLLRYPG